MSRDLSSLLEMYPQDVRPELFYKVRSNSRARYLKHIVDNSSVKDKVWLFAVNSYCEERKDFVFAGFVSAGCRREVVVKLPELVDRFGVPLVKPKIYGYPFLAMQKMKKVK